MSRENVKCLQPLYEAWRRGDYQSGLEVLHPDIEWTAATDIPGGDSVCHGREAVRAFLTDWRGAWSEYRVEAREFIELDLDQVLVLVHEHGRGKTSGVGLQTEFAQLWTIRDGQAVRMQEWRNWHEALKAAGLSEVGDVAGERGDRA
jgi:ketosteroid isomerase-like protein